MGILPFHLRRTMWPLGLINGEKEGFNVLNPCNWRASFMCHRLTRIDIFVSAPAKLQKLQQMVLLYERKLCFERLAKTQAMRFEGGARPHFKDTKHNNTKLYRSSNRGNKNQLTCHENKPSYIYRERERLPHIIAKINKLNWKHSQELICSVKCKVF